jgi:hypothetical protein
MEESSIQQRTNKNKKSKNNILEYVLILVTITVLLYKVFYGGCGCSVPQNTGNQDSKIKTICGGKKFETKK